MLLAAAPVGALPVLGDERPADRPSGSDVGTILPADERGSVPVPVVDASLPPLPDAGGAAGVLPDALPDALPGVVDGLPVVGTDGEAPNAAPSPPSHAEPAPAPGVPATAAVAAAAAVHVLPWEAFGSQLATWATQARDAFRSMGGSLRRALKASPVLGALFSRVAANRLLENPVRARAHGAVVQEPGITLSEVRERAGTAWGTTVHHLRRLERAGLVVSVRQGNQRRYFARAPTRLGNGRPAAEAASLTAPPAARSDGLPPCTPAAPVQLAALCHPTVRRIATLVRSAPGLDQKGICLALGLCNPNVSKHLAKLIRLGLVRSQAQGRSRIYEGTEALALALAALAPMASPAPVAPVRKAAPGPQVPQRRVPAALPAPA